MCSASAVRFIGTQRPSIAIENDVSTQQRHAAWVRASVSCTSTSSISSRTLVAARDRSPRALAGSTALRDACAVTSQGSVSPNAQLAGRARRLAGGAGRAQVALPLPAGHPLGHVAQQRLAELPHRLRA